MDDFANTYYRYEAGKTKSDYYHSYNLDLPHPFFKEISSMAFKQHKPISALIRGYIQKGLEQDKKESE